MDIEKTYDDEEQQRIASSAAVQLRHFEEMETPGAEVFDDVIN